MLVLRGSGPRRTALRDRSAGARARRRCPCARSMPDRERTAELVNAFVEQARRAPRGRRAGQHGPAARLRRRAGPAALPRGVRAARGGDRRVPDVPRARQARRHGRAQDGRHASPTRSRPCASTGRAYDFFFVHYKDTDKAGEDGDFDAKVEALERLRRLRPGDRGPSAPTCSSSPATTRPRRSSPPTAGSRCRCSSASRYCGADPVTAFTERACAGGHARHHAGAAPDAARAGQRACVSPSSGRDAHGELTCGCSIRLLAAHLAGHAARHGGLRLSRGARRARAAAVRTSSAAPPSSRTPCARRRSALVARGARDGLRARPQALRTRRTAASRSTTSSAA